MTRQNPNPNPSLSHLNEADKYFYAGFLNTAMDNVHMAIDEVAKRSAARNESSYKLKIQSLFSETTMLKDREHRRELLCEYIPVLRRIAQTDKGFSWLKFTEEFIALYETLDNLRNYYTHYYHPAVKVPDSIFEFLDFILFDTAMTVKKDRMKLAENKDLMQKKYPEDFKDAYNAPAGKRASAISGVFDKAFWHLIFKDAEEGESKLARSQTRKGDLSANGFLLFLSFFLDRKSMEALFARTEYFKDTRDLRHQATRWVFGYWAFRDIRRHIKSDYDHHALLLQMVDELTKCPAEIYEYLDEKKKEEFVFDINEYYKDNEENMENQENSHVVHPVIRRRYEDKFTYFALRYLDEFGGFTKLKFQVELGSYLHDTRTKTIKDTKFTTDRRIIERLRVFGKLSDISKKKNEYFAEHPEDELADTGWQQYPSPHYVIENGVIPIYVVGFSSPDISHTGPKRKEGKPDKTALAAQILGADVITGQPHAILSAGELPALLHAVLIDGKTGAELEDVIRKKMYAQLNDIRNAESIIADPASSKRKNIPKKLLRAGTAETPWEYDLPKLQTHIRYEIGKCDERLTALSEMQAAAKERQKAFFLNKAHTGEISLWLADDIKRCAKKEEREYWKGYHQAELQAQIAFYRDRRDDIKTLLTREIGINLDNQPALKTALGATRLEEFYENYLRARRKWLSDSADELAPIIEYRRPAKEKELQKLFKAFDRREYKFITDTEAYKKELLKHPIALPRGVFDERPSYIWPHASQDAARAAWYTYATQPHEHMQQFYTYTKFYPTADVKVKLRLSPLDGGIKAQLKKKADADMERHIYKNETAIRQQMRQDVYILAMLRQMFPHVLSVRVADDIDLHRVYTDREQAATIQQRADRQSQRAVGDMTENIVNDKYVLAQLVDADILGGRVRDRMKIKNIGKFKRLELDQRVNALVSYDDKIWQRHELLALLDAYDLVRREQLFRHIHRVEQLVFAALGHSTSEPHPKALEHKGYPNFNNYLAAYLRAVGEKEADIATLQAWSVESNTALPQSLPARIQQAGLLILIRNRLAHQQLPSRAQYQWILQYMQSDSSASIEKTLLACVEKTIGELFRE